MFRNLGLAVWQAALITTVAGEFKSSYFALVKKDHQLKVPVLEEYMLQAVTDCFLRCFGHQNCKAVNLANELDMMNISESSAKINGLFLIRHYGGRWVKLNKAAGKFILSQQDPEYFSWTNTKSLFHVASGKCVRPFASYSDSSIILTDSCDENSVYDIDQQNSMKHVKTGKCIHPLNGYPYPREGREIVIYGVCGERRLQFYIEEKNYIKCQLLGSNKMESSSSAFVHMQNWSYYEPV